MTTDALVSFIKAHALTHYEDGGWDVVVECFTDGEIADAIGDAKTEAQALEAFAFCIDVWSDRQADARNSAF
jgi:hypothetical protein